MCQSEPRHVNRSRTPGRIAAGRTPPDHPVAGVMATPPSRPFPGPTRGSRRRRRGGTRCGIAVAPGAPVDDDRPVDGGAVDRPVPRGGHLRRDPTGGGQRPEQLRRHRVEREGAVRAGAHGHARLVPDAARRRGPGPEVDVGPRRAVGPEHRQEGLGVPAPAAPDGGRRGPARVTVRAVEPSSATKRRAPVTTSSPTTEDGV